MLILLLCSCQPAPPPMGSTSRFDGVYKGTRTLVGGLCELEPMPITFRVRGGHHQSGDRGMIFDIDADGDIVSHGLYPASGHVADGHLTVYLTGTGSRPCTFQFDVHRVAPLPGTA